MSPLAFLAPTYAVARSRGALVVGAAVTALVLGSAGPAAAHVEITPSTTAAGAQAVITVSVPHGCEGSPTTRITIQMPATVTSVVPAPDPEWAVETQMVPVDPAALDPQGASITERIGVVSYTPTAPLADTAVDTFELALRLPDEEGTTVAFPTIQSCGDTESAWIETPSGGESAEGFSYPAPALTLTAPEAAPAEDTESTVAPAPAAANPEIAPADPASAGGEPIGDTAPANDPDDGASSAVIGMGVLGLLALALGAVGLVVARQRRRT